LQIRVVAAAVLGGILAGALDIEAAVLLNHVGPEVVMRAIARGLLGRPALQGGAPAAALGFALQLAMGALIGLIYGLGCLRWPRLARHWIPSGLGYGVCVFLVMNWVVVPLSAVRRFPSFDGVRAAQNLSIMIGFGLIVAFGAHLGWRRRA
jgi:hypothetical protein